ncbi:hypothetical protein C8R43DRAFT_940707 [Mycena crocata]|nr:hypothetical protein C8R43DRAFT_940707 [Mycena crocata]
MSFRIVLPRASRGLNDLGDSERVSRGNGVVHAGVVNTVVALLAQAVDDDELVCTVDGAAVLMVRTVDVDEVVARGAEDDRAAGVLKHVKTTKELGCAKDGELKQAAEVLMCELQLGQAQHGELEQIAKTLQDLERRRVRCVLPQDRTDFLRRVLPIQRIRRHRVLHVRGVAEVRPLPMLSAGRTIVPEEGENVCGYECRVVGEISRCEDAAPHEGPCARIRRQYTVVEVGRAVLGEERESALVVQHVAVLCQGAIGHVRRPATVGVTSRVATNQIWSEGMGGMGEAYHEISPPGVGSPGALCPQSIRQRGLLCAIMKHKPIVVLQARTNPPVAVNGMRLRLEDWHLSVLADHLAERKGRAKLSRAPEMMSRVPETM